MQRNLEPARQIRFAVAEHDNADRHHQKGDEGSDAAHLGPKVQRDDAGQYRDDHTDDERVRNQVERTTMHPLEDPRHHLVAGHGEQDAGLSVQYDQGDTEDGDDRAGFLASSPAVATASRPMNEKKMTPTPAVIPVTPEGAKSAKLLPFQPVRATTAKKTRMASLMNTVIVLTVGRLIRAAHQQHHAGQHQHNGRHIDDPTLVGCQRQRIGKRHPKMLCRNWFAYSDQPSIISGSRPRLRCRCTSPCEPSASSV